MPAFSENTTLTSNAPFMLFSDLNRELFLPTVFKLWPTIDTMAAQRFEKQLKMMHINRFKDLVELSWAKLLKEHGEPVIFYREMVIKVAFERYSKEDVVKLEQQLLNDNFKNSKRTTRKAL